MKLQRLRDDMIFILTVSATFLLLAGVGASGRLPSVMMNGDKGIVAGTKKIVMLGVDQQVRSISRST